MKSHEKYSLKMALPVVSMIGASLAVFRFGKVQKASA
jgi:hypothetical protein